MVLKLVDECNVRFPPLADITALGQSSQVKLLTITLAAFLLPSWMPAYAQLSGEEASSGCISLLGTAPRVTAEGLLTLQIFAGPPNYESIAGGDAEERIFILELPRSACIDDGGNFADPVERFVTVQVSSTDQAFLRVLRASVDRHVIVSGEGMGSHTGHHRAPLVLFADRITVH